MVTGPTLLFAALAATLLGALCHVIFGGGLRRLLALLAVSWAAFALGHLIGVAAALPWLRVGTLHAATAAATAVLALGLVQVLAGSRTRTAAR